MSRILGCDPGEGGADRLHEFGSGSGLGAAEHGFDFAPHLLDRVEVGRVGRQEENLGTGAVDEGKGSLAFMGTEVVHHDDVAWTQRGSQDFAYVGVEHLRIGRSFDRHTGSGAIQAQGADHRRGLPMAGRTAGVQAFAPGRTPT